MEKYNILKPTKILVVGMHNYINIPLIIVDKFCTIQLLDSVIKTDDFYLARKQCISKMEKLIEQYEIDMILFEKNKLFIDKIDKYPDPYVLHNVLFAFGLQTSIEDKFYETVKYIVEIPQYEWKKKIFGTPTYSIDLYRAHILLRNYDKEQLSILDKFNYYETLCLSECILYEEFLRKKYQINS